MSQPYHSSCPFRMRMLLLMLLLPFLAAAQPRLELLSASGAAGDSWGSLSFKADCPPMDRFHVSPGDLTLWENGRRTTNVEIVQCSGDLRQIIGVALVLDGSANMDSVESEQAKLAAHTFIDLMDGIRDEATITLFNDHPVTYQQMTTVKPMLHSAIDALGANGGSALYDALYLSVIEVAFNTQNPGRALILMTDSRNDSSYRRLDEVLDAAKQYRIPIHVVRMGDQSDSTELRMIASETGGRYYHAPPNAGQLAALYTEIATPKGEQACQLRYYRRCYAGGDAEVILQWRAPCGGTVADTISYTAAYDSSTVEPLKLALTADTAIAKEHMHLRLRVVDPVEGRARGPIAFTLQYDTTLLSFPYPSMPQSSLIEAEDIRLEPVAGGVRVTAGSALPEREWKEGVAPLLGMIFRAHAPAGRGDTIPYVIAVTDVAFVEGCPDLTINGTTGVIFRDAPLSAGEPPAAASPTLAVWPNPASGRVYVAIPGQSRSDGVLSVYDALGRTMMIRNIPNGRSQEFLDLSALPRGLYMLRYTAGAAAWMTRCIHQ